MAAERACDERKGSTRGIEERKMDGVWEILRLLSAAARPTIALTSGLQDDGPDAFIKHSACSRKWRGREPE
jgi:hypothetical protein